MRIAGGLLIITLSGCASTHLPVEQTASQRFSTLGYREKQVASEFYQLGEGDSIKRYYWGQRDSQRYGRAGAEADPQPSYRGH